MPLLLQKLLHFEEMKSLNNKSQKVIGYKNSNTGKEHQAIQWNKTDKHPLVFQDYISCHGGDTNI